ncbi:MAG: hypothetical protein ACE5LU_21050 [Anaerolineae bacterium]
MDGLNTPPLNTHPAINRAHLDDLAMIYYHTHQAWQLADSVKPGPELSVAGGHHRLFDAEWRLLEGSNDQWCQLWS